MHYYNLQDFSSKKSWTQGCWNKSQYVDGLSNNEGGQENRYRMEWTNTYMGIDNVTMHVIEDDIALSLGIMLEYEKTGKLSPLL